MSHRTAALDANQASFASRSRRSGRSGLGRRRALLLGAWLASSWLPTACSTPPPPPPPPAPASPRQEALRELGFAKTDDGWYLDLGGRVAFSSNDATLSPEALATIERVATMLLRVGIDHVTVEGHTDNQGGQEYNRRLSERRAEVVAQALAKHGFAIDHIIRRGHGASRPIADNGNEAGRLQNRRAVLIVSSV